MLRNESLNSTFEFAFYILLKDKLILTNTIKSELKINSKFLPFAVLVSIISAQITSAHAADIAVIIDDMGNNRSDAKAFMLPKEVAFSILPLTYLSKTFSRRAAKQQREVMLHVPMEALSGKALGPGAITADMNPIQIRQMLSKALASVPDAIGVNNHMGSKLTQLSLPMQTTMAFLTEKQLFFVDSRTTRYSVAEKIARENGVLSSKRNVFLDHNLDPMQMEVQFNRLIALSKKYGTAVCIAHPYPESIKYLSAALERLSEHNVTLITVSEIVDLQEIARNQSPSSGLSMSLD